MKGLHDSLTFSLFQWVLISIRSLMFFSVLCINYVIQKLIGLISPLFPFQIWKRYLSCVVSLITNRMALIVLGCFQIQSQGFQFFSKTQVKITLKSGFIGLGNHKNIMDFLYYSALFNPLFVRLILIVDKEVKDGKEVEYIKDVNYAPLYFEEALECAMSNRGFDPIVIRNQKEIKKVKYRKMNMKTLVSESFEQMMGAIFILLPGISHDEHIQIEQRVAMDVFENELKFLRSGVGLKVSLGKRQVFSKPYKNQLHFLLQVMSQLKLNRMQVQAMAFRNFKSMYTKSSYRDFMEENFFLMKNQLKLRKISYLDYLENVQEKNNREESNNLQEKNNLLEKSHLSEKSHLQEKKQVDSREIEGKKNI